MVGVCLVNRVLALIALSAALSVFASLYLHAPGNIAPGSYLYVYSCMLGEDLPEIERQFGGFGPLG